jgi:uncharacterized protein (DUF433 family)
MTDEMTTTLSVYPKTLDFDTLRYSIGEFLGWALSNRIVVDENILVGKPVVKGTRLAVEFIIELLAYGWSEDDILQNYPGLEREDIRACLLYASAILHAEKVYPFPVRSPDAPVGG